MKRNDCLFTVDDIAEASRTDPTLVLERHVRRSVDDQREARAIGVRSDERM